jgi:2-polyprenyl-3-methyl-5-hydroxy-6-metoxy-1,4-benzoquinol methylase
MENHHISWTPDKIAAFWDFVSSNDAQAGMYFTHQAGAGVARHVARTVLRSGQKVLDFGCGPGHLFPHLARRVPTMHYYGLDFSQASIDQLIQRWEKEPQFTGGAVISAFPAGLEGGFDVIVAIEVIEHLDDSALEQICETFSRLLRTGGQLYLSTPNNENLAEANVLCPDCRGVFHRWQHMRSWNTETLIAQMAKHGFREDQTHELIYANQWVRGELLTFARRIFRLPQPSLCYVGTKV